jgi:hypothetical protein
VSAIVFGRRPRGSMVQVEAPIWVPAAGEVAVLSTANGLLTNSFQSQCAGYFSPFYYIKTCNDFSGGIVNPHFGAFGAVAFFGGGHSGTNDNTVTHLVLHAAFCTFVRAVDPTPYTGSGTDETTRLNNSNGNVNSVLDWDTGTSTIDGHPVSPHSYGCHDIIAPADGGGAHGSLQIVLIPAMNRSNDGSAASAHRVNYATASDTPGAFDWTRLGTDFVALADPDTGGANAEGTQWAANCWTQWVPALGYTFIETNNNHDPRWFDHNTLTYESGAGTRRDRAPDNPNSGTMFHVPSRDLLIHMERVSGNLRISYMPVSASDTDPSWSATHPTLSAALAVPDTWSCACWCEDNNRIIVGDVSSVDDAVYEIEIPATLTDTWTVTEAPFGSGQTITWSTAGNSYKKWSHNPSAKCILYFHSASNGGTDTAWAYRPRNT